MIVLVSKDLMMSSTVSSSARSSDRKCKVVGNVAGMQTAIEENEVDLVLIDLQTNALDFDLIQEVASRDERPRLVGYAQHVNLDALNRGREIGLDQVLTRGQMHSNVAAVLQG